MLGNSKVGGVDLADVNSIPRLNQRFEQFENKVTASTSQESFYIFKHKCSRSNTGDQATELADQRIPLIIRAPHSCRRKSLAGRSAGNDGRFRENQLTSDLCLMNVIPKVCAVRLDSWQPMIIGRKAFESCSLESKRESARSAKQIYDCWMHDGLPKPECRQNLSPVGTVTSWTASGDLPVERSRESTSGLVLRPAPTIEGMYSPELVGKSDEFMLRVMDQELGAASAMPLQKLGISKMRASCVGV